MKRSRRNHSSKFKARVAMEALRGEATLEDRPPTRASAGNTGSSGTTLKVEATDAAGNIGSHEVQAVK